MIAILEITEKETKELYYAVSFRLMNCSLLFKTEPSEPFRERIQTLETLKQRLFAL